MLDVEPRANPELRPSLGGEVRELAPPGGDLRAGPERHVELGRGERPHREQAGTGKSGSKLGRLSGRRDHQPIGPSGDRRAGALDGAVAVAVRLHHDAQRGALGELSAQPGAVALDGPEVDDGERSQRPACGHGTSAAGRAAMTSVATTDSAARTRSAAIRPAR